jgi:hydroxyacylglutathione hydrolase
MIKIIRIPAFKDNYIWLLVNARTKNAAVIDPGEAQPVLTILEANQYTLQDILITHHHWDHTGGVAGLFDHTKATVYGSEKDAIPCLTHPLNNRTSIYLSSLELTVEIIYIPGHTLGHVAYLIGHKLFCGDTLFTAGCGRIFEGSTLQMFNSLNSLKSLDLTTEVYCGHEYTLSNLRFASQVEPTNANTHTRLKTVTQWQRENKASVPSSLSLELETNPFLRTHIPSVRSSVEQHFQQPYSTELQIFAALRQWKDSFTY